MRRAELAWALLGCCALVGLWEAAARSGHGFVMPSPMATFEALLRIFSQADFWRHDISVSFGRVFCGVSTGGISGICLGLAAGFVKPLRLMLTPVRWMLSSVPGVVVVMLGMLWLGIDSEMVIFVVTLTVAPTVYVGVVEGISAIDPGLREMARAYRIKPMLRVRHIFLPAIAAPLLSSTVIALGGGMRVAILAETIGATRGLGHSLAVARANLDTAELYALALTSMLLVGIFEAVLLNLAKRRMRLGRSS